MADIVVTWPKSRAFSSYMVELERAKANRLVVCFRVPSRPTPTPGRCYRVHDGQVRGWLDVLTVCPMGQGQVRRVGEPDLIDRVPTGMRFWPPGLYVVCEPDWHELRPRIAMRGFRGWRWYERSHD